MKVLFVGFDGLAPQLVFPRGDKLPAIEALCRRGAWGELESYCDVPLGGPAWTTIYTGLLREQHSVKDGYGRPVRGYKTFATCEAEYVWDVLAEHGFSVGLFNLPVTYPARPIPRSLAEEEKVGCKNWMVSGFPTPDPANNTITWPDFLQSELVVEGDLMRAYFPDPMQFFTCKILGQDRGFIDYWYQIALDSGEEMVGEIVETVSRHQLQVCLRLFRNHPVDVGFCQFLFLDRIGHLWGFYSDEEKPDRWYRLVDEFVGTLVEQERPENVLIVSDHGFRDDNHLRNGVIILNGQCFNSRERITRKIQEVPGIIKGCLGMEPSATADEEIAGQRRASGCIE